MTGVIKWGSIDSLHNVLKWAEGGKEAVGRIPPKLVYGAKVKLHGTNTGVQVFTDHGVVNVLSQSRANILSLENDHLGFAKWVHSNLDFFSTFRGLGNDCCTVYGEWCGPGICKKTAINQIPHKIFAIFAIRINDLLVTDPEKIKSYLPMMPDQVKVIPWMHHTFTIDWDDREDVRANAERINDAVKSVEECDPWVRDTFGIEGIGEDIVLYPVELSDRDECMRYMFKAKGEKHKVVRSKPAQLDLEVAESIEEFVDLFVTPARLEQGFQEGCDGVVNTDLTGSFVKWVNKDILKESQNELEASGLGWKQVAKSISRRAGKWYQERVKEI